MVDTTLSPHPRVELAPAPAPATVPLPTTTVTFKRRLKLAAVASNGGHYVQLRRIAPLFDQYDTNYYVADRRELSGDAIRIKQFSRVDLHTAFVTSFQLFTSFARHRPDLVITTGSAPGLLALVIGRLFGARTIWLDSIANVEHLSGSGRIAKRLAHHCLTQWPAVAQREKVSCIGNVL